MGQTLTLLGLEGSPPGLPDGHDSLRENERHTWEKVRNLGRQRRRHLSDRATYVLDDAIHWLAELPSASIHAIVTDPPYGVLEYEEKDLDKLRAGRGGVWRIPPSFDGAKRNPLPRFTVMSGDDLASLHGFFSAVAYGMLQALTPGGHVFIASNPLLSSMTFHAFQEAGFEKRGEIIRLVQTLRGGYKPKGSEDDFPGVSVMPRSCWEPWGMFRKPFEGTVAGNLRRWGTGGLRRISSAEPFKDVIICSPTRAREKAIAPHPSLKPQRFLRQLVRASLPWVLESSTIRLQAVNPHLRRLRRSATVRLAPTVTSSTLSWAGRRSLNWRDFPTHYDARMTPDDLYTEFNAGFAARKFSAGLLVAFIDLLNVLGVPGTGMTCFADFLARFPRQLTTKAGKSANTVFLDAASRGNPEVS